MNGYFHVSSEGNAPCSVLVSLKYTSRTRTRYQITISFLSHRRYISRNTSSTLFLMCSWRTSTGAYAQITWCLFTVHILRSGAVGAAVWQFCCCCSSQLKERCLWSGDPEPAEVSESQPRLRLQMICYFREFRVMVNNLCCVISGKQRCWTTLRTRVRTRSCRTPRGRPTSCSFPWRRRRTCPPGLSSPRYCVRARAPTESSHFNFCPSCISIVRKSVCCVFVSWNELWCF